MKLIRYNSPLNSDLDRFFDAAFAGLSRGAPLRDTLADTEARVPNLDLYQDDKARYARFELPGAKRDEIKVNVENRILTVSVERTTGEDDKSETRTLFRRSLRLPTDSDTAGISARYTDGILELTLPKTEAAQARAIFIN